MYFYLLPPLRGQSSSQLLNIKGINRYILSVVSKSISIGQEQVERSNINVASNDSVSHFKLSQKCEQKQFHYYPLMSLKKKREHIYMHFEKFLQLPS